MNVEHSLNIPVATSGAVRRRLPAVLAALFGLALVFAAGFSENQMAHSAAHDTRHATGFPCH